MEVENTHIQNEKPEFAAHAGREMLSWCRWRRLRAVYSIAQETVQEHQSAPEAEDNQTKLELVEVEHNRPTVIGLGAGLEFPFRAGNREPGGILIGDSRADKCTNGPG
jgi:hypothetical protein